MNNSVTFLVCAKLILLAYVTYKSVLRMKDTPPISQTVVGQVSSLLIVGKICIHGRLDCYCSFAKIQDKTKKKLNVDLV